MPSLSGLALLTVQQKKKIRRHGKNDSLNRKSWTCCIFLLMIQLCNSKRNHQHQLTECTEDAKGPQNRKRATESEDLDKYVRFHSSILVFIVISNIIIGKNEHSLMCPDCTKANLPALFRGTVKFWLHYTSFQADSNIR